VYSKVTAKIGQPREYQGDSGLTHHSEEALRIPDSVITYTHDVQQHEIVFADGGY
jgi:hypothetical protein